MATDIQTRLTGCVHSVFTPFNADEEVDYETLERYLRHLFDTGARRFYVMAYNSRYAQLTDDEVFALNAFVARTVKSFDRDCIVIVGDPIHCTTKRSAEFARHAGDIGADLISLLVQEKHYADEQILEHFAQIGRESATPQLVHEMAFLSGFDGKQMHWPVSLLEGLRKIPQIAALKEDAKDFEITAAALKLEPDIRVVISGPKKALMQYRELGVRAYLNGISMIDARISDRFWRAFTTGDATTTTFIIDRIETPLFAGAVAKYGWHRVNKAFLEAAGLMPRRDLMPLMPLTDAECEDVRADFLVVKTAVEELLAA